MKLKAFFPADRIPVSNLTGNVNFSAAMPVPGISTSGNLNLTEAAMTLHRLTFFNDYEGGKASNPVVSTDGRFMAFQSAKATDPAGVGYGILIYWFKK